MCTHRQINLLSGTLQLIGNLYARRSRSYYQYSAFGQLLRIAVLG